MATDIATDSSAVEEPQILSVQDERKELKSLGIKGDISLKPNETWYPVEFRWYQMWKNYTQWDKKDADLDLPNLHQLDYERPGPIDNSELFDTEDPNQIKLRKELTENETHVFVHAQFWERYMQWYGGGPAFPRDVVSRGTAGMDKRIDMFPQFLRVCMVDDDGKYDEEKGDFQRFPLDYTLQQVYDKIAKGCGADKTPKTPLRLWTKFGKIKGCFVLENKQVTEEMLNTEDEDRLVEIPDDQFAKLKLEDMAFDIGQTLVVEKTPYPLTKGEDDWKNFQAGDVIDGKDLQKKWYQSVIRGVKEADGVTRICVHYIGWDPRWDEWIEVNESTLENRLARRGTNTTKPYRRKPKQTYTQSSSYSYRSSYQSGGGGWSIYKDDTGSPLQEGVVGLRNLGNTCFMNSTLQCLAQSPILTEYFVSGQYKSEVNLDNPLGWKGKVANAWADLVIKMFSNSYKTIAPREFKQAIGEVAPRFMGYSQQDSQELLSFLLDGLHEDLNRIRDKPMTEAVDSADRPDNVVADHAWKTYLKRNQSIIVDVMQGQYKSKVDCPDCSRVSITFDPYMFLSVPLPTEKYKTVTLTYCDLMEIGIPPKVYGFKVLKIGDMRTLKDAISRKLEIPNENLHICDVWKSKIQRVFADHDMVQDIRRRTDDIWIIRSPYLFQDPNYHESLPPEEPEEAPPTTASRSTYYGAGGSSHSSYKPRKVGPWKNYYFHNQTRAPPKTTTSYGRTYTSTYPQDEVFGAPQLLTLPTKVPVTGRLVRERLMEIIAPFLRDPEAGDYPFEMNMMVGYSKVVPLPDTDEPLDIQPQATATQIRFFLQWESKEAYNTEIVDQRERDESAGAPPSASTTSSSYRGAESGNTAPVDLLACFEAFTEEETLSESDAWYCSQCQDFKCATKKIDLWSSPDLLIIHLKRFSYTRLWRDRINTLVNFPIEGLDLTPYIGNAALTDNIYDLYAVSNHMGGLGGGHYTAYAKNLKDHQWYHLDDSRATLLPDASRVVSSSAYVLYYQKRKPYGITHRASLYVIPGIDDQDDGDNGDDGDDATEAN